MKKLVLYFLLNIILIWNFQITTTIPTAQSQDWQGSVIDDPALTSRCQELIEERNQKITFRQKLAGLIQRNERLKKITPVSKLTIKKKLDSNYKRLSHEFELSKLKLTNMEENIIRKGCPGITL